MSYPLVDAENEIRSLLKQALAKLNYACEIKLEIPPKDMGDFAFPCFLLAPIAKKSPQQIAEGIVQVIKKSAGVNKVESRGGYVNFFVNVKQLAEGVLKGIAKQKENYGTLPKKKKKVIIEHTSANPNGPLHVGRARNPIIGDTMARIFAAAGYDVDTQFYLDDMGKQVATLAWGISNIDAHAVPQSSSKKTDHQTVGYYQIASSQMKEDATVAEEIAQMVKQSEKGDNKTIELIRQAYAPVLQGINESLQRINIKIDSYVPESNFVKDRSVDTVIDKLKKLPYCHQDEGAYYLDLESFGIRGRNTKFFFIRSDGTTLYATRDIAYHLWKAQHADMLVNVLGEDHKLESKQVQIALKLLDAPLTPHVIFYSFVSLPGPGGKMSTRRGRVVYLDDLIDECIKRAYNEVSKRRKTELTKKKMSTIADIVGIGALRYNILKVQPEKGIVFTWEDALNFEGNAAPFVQYAHARCCSILAKKEDNIQQIDAAVLTHESEIDLIKKLGQFPLIIDQACRGYRPHSIATYVYEVASQFNQFYRDCPVLPENNTKRRVARLALVEGTRVVLNNGLRLLGITAPEEM
ncbi:MAG: arginine--tRNA ligase [Candidatus Thermoplasmatota archaeon]|nr:arginine--tRNA ligase [Candidatus Thermoplasmatota archaeon]